MNYSSTANSTILTENNHHDNLHGSSHNFKSLFYQFMHSVTDEIELYAKKKRNLILPKISKSTIIDICCESESIFSAEPSLIDLNSPCLIIGDLHGHVLDLFRILKYFGVPHDDHMNPKYKDGSNFELLNHEGKVCNPKYVFLGDIIDRGEFSVETITIVLLLKILYPENVFIIRGNHEFDFLAKQCGFLEQVLSAFNDSTPSTCSGNNHGELWSKREPDNDSGLEVYSSFMKTFSYIPFGVRIDDKMLCVHGGIGPQVFSIKSVSEIKRPISEFGISDVADSLLWSDPSDKPELGNRPEDGIIKTSLPTSLPPGSTFSEPIISPLRSTFSEHPTELPLNSPSGDCGKLFEPSSRGTGFVFGFPALDEFLHYSNIEVLVRAHECVMGGCEEMFNGRLITVFSASNYCGFVRNFSAVLHVMPIKSGTFSEKISERCEVFRFFPLDYLRKPAPIAIPLKTNSNTGQFSARSANGGYNSGRRCPSISGRSAPIGRFPQNPIPTRISSARTEAEDMNLHLVSPRDTHKMAGIKICSASSYTKRDIVESGSRSSRVNARMSELPTIVAPKSRQPSQLNPVIQSTPQSNRRISAAGLVLAPKVKPRARSEFK